MNKAPPPYVLDGTRQCRDDTREGGEEDLATHITRLCSSLGTTTMCTRAIPRDTTADDMNSVAVQWVHSQQFCSVPSSDTLWERRLASPSRNTTLAPALLQETTSPLVVSSDDRISKAKYATRHFLEFFGRKEGIPATHIVGQEQFDARIYEMASRAAKPD
ncbi:hypothetical protein FOZ63_013464, partial [Perkinsus olseni]